MLHDWFTGWGSGMLVMLALWVVSLLALALLVSRLVSAGSGPPRETPLEVLQKRYARGEINREEYEQKRRDLTG